VYSERIEKIKPLTASLITARALASVEILCEYAFIHLQKEGKCLFQKGRDVDEELATASKKWHFDYQKYTSIVETDSVILKISNLEFKH
jgi:16S rRNA (guanine527-N7)-methyltransferase